MKLAWRTKTMSNQQDSSPNYHLYFRQNSPDEYPIIIQNNFLRKIPEFLEHGNRYLIITDANVGKIYGTELKECIRNAGKECELISFPAGEKHKNLATYNQLHEQIELRLDRKSCIITLGGGVTGDLAGFVAATYMRGINFIHIPTSLLAMVDASVGGKLGVNTSKGKNCVGVFTNPKAVFIDPQVLDTLPEKIWAEGFAEIIKHALLSPDPLLNLIEKYLSVTISQKKNLLPHLISESVKVKLDIVERDYKVGNVRKFLNFGHTVGHALEEYFHFGEVSHGQGVSLGMLANLAISLNRKYISEELITQIQKLLIRVGLPTSLGDLNLTLDRRKLMELFEFDKKTENHQISFVLLREMGHPELVIDVSTDEILRGIEYIV